METSEEIRLKTKGLVRRTFIVSMFIFLASFGLSLAFGTTKIALSFFYGWIVSFASFAFLVFTVSKAIEGQKAMSMLAALVGILKLLFIGAAIWFLITMKLAEPVAFLGGFTTVVLALVTEAFKIRKPCKA